MAQTFDLQKLRTAKPCDARWDQMAGDGRCRFCQQCGKNVYNVAGLSGREVKELVEGSEETPCMRIARRADGTVITRDCPVGVAAVVKRMSFAALGGAVLLVLSGYVWMMGGRPDSERKSLVDNLRDKPVIGPIIEQVSPSPAYVVGEIAVPPTIGKISGP